MSSMTYVTDAATLGTGLLLARLILGVLMVAHGGQKLFGWLGGYGIAGTAGFFEQLGFRPGRLFVVTASLSEVVGGLLLALGLFGPVGPALLLSVMIVAAISVHWKNGLFAGTNGIEGTVLSPDPPARDQIKSYALGYVVAGGSNPSANVCFSTVNVSSGTVGCSGDTDNGAYTRGNLVTVEVQSNVPVFLGAIFGASTFPVSAKSTVLINN